MSEFLWGAYPYICAILFFTVPVIRMVYRPFGWSTRASGIFGRKVLGAASVAMHWGLGFLFLGHLFGYFGGLLGVAWAVSAFYWSGLFGGFLVLVGSAVALVRRLTVPEVRAMSQHDDYLVHLFILTLVGLGLYQVLAMGIFGNAYPAAAWMASLWSLSPQPELMASATPVIQIHVLVALTFLAYFPFTKLVHFWSYPLNYLVRPYQAVRTLEDRFRSGWEFGLRSDRSVMLLGMAGIAGTLAVGAALLGRPTLDGRLAAGESSGRGTAGAEVATAGAAGRVEQREALKGYPLYVAQCARCHGLDGRGRGPGAGSSTFDLRPRNLVTGSFHFVSTRNGVATRADLRRTLRQGLAGSGMPAFDQLSGRQIQSLLDVTLSLRADREAPGEVVEPPPRPPVTDSLVERGSQLYTSLCGQCHGPEGRGDGPAATGIRTARGEAVTPRNLATGRLKGPRTPEALYTRIVAGIPGGPEGGYLMPSFPQLPPRDVWAVVSYLEGEMLDRRGSAVADRSRPGTR